MTDWRTIPQDPQIIMIDDFYPDLEWVLPYVESSIPIVRSNVNYGGCSFTPPPDRLEYALKKYLRQ